MVLEVPEVPILRLENVHEMRVSVDTQKLEPERWSPLGRGSGLGSPYAEDIRKI